MLELSFYCYFCLLCVLNTGATTLLIHAAQEPHCPINMQHITLNYENTIHGTSNLIFFVLRPDDSTLDGDVTTALYGSGSWLALPSTDDKPMRLIIRRPMDSTSRQFGLISVTVRVLYARRIVVEVHNDQNEAVAKHAVS